MASYFFSDYEFPVELYDRSTGSFSVPIQTLLDFTPSILEQLPKNEKDQEPLRPTTAAQSEAWRLPTPSWSLPSFLSSHNALAIGEYLLRGVVDYLNEQNDRQRRTSPRKQRKQRRRRQRETPSETDSETSETEQPNAQSGTSAPASSTSVKEKKAATSRNALTVAKSSAAIGALTLSLYSTYNANVALGDISFHDQLELLLSHVHAISQSVDVWLKERALLGDPAPAIVRKDLERIKTLAHTLERLDPRQQKKMEAAGWGIGAVGSLSVLGGVLLDNTWALSAGTVTAIGGALLTVGSMARTKSATLAARMALTRKIHDTLAALSKDQHHRKLAIQTGFVCVKKEEPMENEVPVKKGEPSDSQQALMDQFPETPTGSRFREHPKIASC
ncbi:hypothetical protein DM01DRAFT_1335048 [Hesseltinella vesiculosa]|uniref:Uncharacterized protein n=1 Tax=Hesseltinella vesiculosa TaxID=101127 RepID=A0A1X2GK73_9FUNG|nr:hypothetical protein DM01DRAFT_1335048 [Hesseltinella vesiculosa]